MHIGPTGSIAMHERLTPCLFDVSDSTCGAPSMALRFFTEQMRVLLAFAGDFVDGADPIACRRAASRITLRQALLVGLENVHFGKTFERYEQRDSGIIAYFADGSSAEGDVLVAADGGGSRVRRQFLPQAQRREGCRAAQASAGRGNRGERDVAGALHEYEIGMRDCGFRAARNSLKAMRQTVTDRTTALVFWRTMLRAIGALPSARRRMARWLGVGMIVDALAVKA